MAPGRLDVLGVSYDIGRTRILHDIDLSFRSGHLTVLLGASGSGKTTLLRVAAGLVRPGSGSVELDGAAEVPRGAVKIALQEDPVYANLDVDDNLGFPLDIRSTEPRRRRQAVDTTARSMGVRKLLGRRADRLSGGEQAAVSVGRTLMETGQRFVLLDEPLAKADARRRAAFARRARDLIRARPDLGLVVATNDPAHVLRSADHLVVIDAGRVQQQGAPDEVLADPVSTLVAGLVGETPMNLIPATVERLPDADVVKLGADRVRLAERAPEAAVGRAVLFGVWPEDLVVAGPGTPFDRAIHVSVADVEPLGGIVRFGLGAHPVPAYTVALTRLPELRRGDQVELAWRSGRHRFFAVDTGRAIR